MRTTLGRVSLLGLLTLAAAAAPLAGQQAPAAAVSPAMADSLFSAGMQEGTTTAQTVGTGLWAVGGFAGGAALGPIGAGLAYALASSAASALPAPITTRIGKKEADFQLGYQQAYTDRLTARRKSSAVVGGAAGTALLAVGALVFLAM